MQKIKTIAPTPKGPVQMLIPPPTPYQKLTPP